MACHREDSSALQAPPHIGALLAVSVAALFVTACEKTPAGPAAGGPMPSAQGAAKPGESDSPEKTTVQCLGIHECKGKSACHIAGGHTCAGQNSCKGKGWISVSRAECDAKGGKVLDG